MSESYQIIATDWETSRGHLLSVRKAVFVIEQGVPEEIEEDEDDPRSAHFLARDGAGEPVGTARLLPEGRIGRVAVLREWRSRGVGRALMQAAMAAWGERGGGSLRLHAQSHSIPFYASLGFLAEGPEFDEAGIPHREMRWDGGQKPA